MRYHTRPFYSINILRRDCVVLVIHSFVGPKGWFWSGKVFLSHSQIIKYPEREPSPRRSYGQYVLTGAQGMQRG